MQSACLSYPPSPCPRPWPRIGYWLGSTRGGGTAIFSIGQAIGKGWKAVWANKGVLISVSIASLILYGVLELSLGTILNRVEELQHRRQLLGRGFEPWIRNPLTVHNAVLGIVGWALVVGYNLIIMGWMIISLKIVRGQKPETLDVFASFGRTVPVAGLTFFLIAINVLLSLPIGFLSDAIGWPGWSDLENLFERGYHAQNGSLVIDGPLSWMPFVVLTYLPVLVFTLLVFFSMCFAVEKKMGVCTSVRTAMGIALRHKIYFFLFLPVLLGVLLFLMVWGRWRGQYGGFPVQLVIFSMWPLAFLPMAHIYEGITREVSAHMSNDPLPE
jgi:hypothetical protein